MFPFAAGAVDTGGKIATGVIDNGVKFANLPPVSRTLAVLVANLLPVWLIPVVYLDLQISQQIVEKILNDPNTNIREVWGKMIHDKKLEAKNLVTLSL